jgi:ADP-ribose pyrophosphatase YjhB (NUDIX family)
MLLFRECRARGHFGCEERETLSAVADRSARLVGTGEAAREIGVDSATLWRWVSREGRIRPTLRTAGGQLRFDVNDLRQQLAAGRQLVVVAVVTTGTGELLVTRAEPDRQWELPAGYPRRGESVTEAAAREVHQQTGVPVMVTHELARELSASRARTTIYLAALPAGAPTAEFGAAAAGSAAKATQTRWLGGGAAAEVVATLPPAVRELVGESHPA